MFDKVLIKYVVVQRRIETEKQIEVKVNRTQIDVETGQKLPTITDYYKKPLCDFESWIENLQNEDLKYLLKIVQDEMIDQENSVSEVKFQQSKLRTDTTLNFKIEELI